MHGLPPAPRIAALDPVVSVHAGPTAHETPTAWYRRLATPAALLALCVLSAAFFWRVVLLHEVLLPGDIPYVHDPLWHPLIPHTFRKMANPLDADALTEFYPWTALAAQALHQGVVPLWNPYAFAGTPFLAAMQTAVFYPINVLLEWLLPPVDVLGARAIVHLALTASGSFLFAWRLGRSRAAALLTAAAFGFSLPYVVWLEHPMAGAIAWLPWLLLCVEGVVATAGSLRWNIAAALVVALEILAGHGESTAHVLLLCTAYGLFRAVIAWRDERAAYADTPLWRLMRAPAALALALLLGAAMAAAHLLPVLENLPGSEAVADRTLNATGGVLGNGALWPSLAAAAVPNFFGNPTWGFTLSQGGAFNESALYAGIVPLVLASVALLRRRNAYTIFFAVAALVMLGVALRLPIVGLLDDLPGLRVTANGRLRAEYAFLVAVLAGYGLDALLQGDALTAAWRAVQAWWLLVLALVGIALTALWRAQAHSHRLPAVMLAQVTLPLLWLSLFAICLWLCRRGMLRTSALAWVAVALVVADLVAAGIGYHETMPRARALAMAPAIRAIQSDHTLYRVVGMGEALMPSLSSLYGLQDIRGYDPAYAAAYERYFTTLFSSMAGMRLGLAARPLTPAQRRALDLMNVKYIFTACNKPLPGPALRLIYNAGGCVYRNDAALPRAMLVHRVAWATPGRAVDLLGAGQIDPRRTALLDPATAAGTLWRIAPGGTGESVRVTRYTMNDVAIEVRTPSRAVLVLTDSYALGWSATIDGRDTPIARADAVFRAVAVPAGAHTIVWTYRPESFSIGIAVSASAGVLWLALALVVLIRRRYGRSVARILRP